MAGHSVIQEIRTATGSTFDRLVLKGNGPIVVEFMSYGCAHCRSIAPILEQAEKMIGHKEQIFMVNIAADPELAESYSIQGTPTFIMFLNGEAIATVEGLKPDLAEVVTALTQPYE